MISCRKCLAVLANYHLKGTVFPKINFQHHVQVLIVIAGFQMCNPITTIRSNCITTLKTRDGPGYRHLSSNPNCRANIKSQGQNDDTQKISEEEIELHEEETEEIHSTYLFSNFVSEPSEGTEVLLDKVPKFAEACQENLKNQGKIVLQTKSEMKSSKAKTKVAEKKLRDQILSEEAKAAAIELQKKKEIAYRFSLKSYLTMCMHHNMVYKAMLLLRNYHGEVKHFKSSIVYDAVLREASVRCSWKLIKEIVSMMEQGGVPFSLESFAACFIGLGVKSERESGLEAISENLLDKMEACGFHVNDIFKHCKFLSNQRELVVKGIRLGLPNFQPEFPSTPLTYTTPLLTSLNDTHVDSVVSSQVEGLLTEDKYRYQIVRIYKSSF